MTDSQYLASIDISEDQNVITGVTLVAVDFDYELVACRRCALLDTDICFNVECTANLRADGRDVIFVVKSNDYKLKLESSK